MSLVSSIVESVVSGGASAVLGGITGVVGGAVTRYFDFKNAGLKNQSDAQAQAHELAMKGADLEITKAEAASNFKITQETALSAESMAETQAFQTALTIEPQRFADVSHVTPGQNWLLVCLDVVRGLIRPGLTAYLAVLTSLIYWQNIHVMAKEGMTMDPEHAFTLVNGCQDTVTYLFTTAVCFWFGTRNKASEAKSRGLR